jgi:hypothetical protein
MQLDYRVTEVDAGRNIIYITNFGKRDYFVHSSLFRNIESLYKFKKSNIHKAWRIVVSNPRISKPDLVTINESYLGWDKRYNPHIKEETWHGLAWDALKND